MKFFSASNSGIAESGPTPAAWESLDQINYNSYLDHMSTCFMTIVNCNRKLKDVANHSNREHQLCNNSVVCTLIIEHAHDLISHA